MNKEKYWKRYLIIVSNENTVATKTHPTFTLCFKNQHNIMFVYENNQWNEPQNYIGQFKSNPRYLDIEITKSEMAELILNQAMEAHLK